MFCKARIVLLSLATVIFSLATTILGQTTDKKTEGCGTKLRVTLISTERRYVLTKGNPINITLRAENCSNESVTIESTPLFSFLREEIGKEWIVKYRFKYWGRVASDWPRTPEPICIPPSGSHEFYVDASALEVKNVAWSVSLWYDPVEQLENGDFEFRGAVKLENRNENESDNDVWSSNIMISSFRTK